MHDKIIEKIDEAIKMVSDLTKNRYDKYAHAHEALMIAKLQLLPPKSKDRSAECKCDCHTGRSMHFVECSCYNGDPYLG